MTQVHQVQDATGDIIKTDDGKIIFALRTAKPADGTAGYVVGAEVLIRTGGASTSVYINRGTEASCTFVAQAAGLPIAGGTLTGALTTLGITITDANDVVFGSTTGTKLGTGTAQKVAFHNSTPVIQRAGASQAAVTDTVGSAVVGTGATNSSPYGYAQAQADAIVTNINALRVDVIAITALVNELRAAMVEKGLIKGAA